MTDCLQCGRPCPPRKQKHGKRNGPIIRFCSGACRAKYSRIHTGKQKA